MSRLVFLYVIAMFLLPALAYAETVQCTNSYVQPPKTLTYTLPPGMLNPGANQHGTLRDNVQAARADIDKSFYTPELTSFNDADCGGTPCRNDIPGVAHRTWPKGSCVAVCNSKTRKCGIAIVMDKGPNTNLGCRTIDANPALQAVLGMGPSDTVAASYQLKSLPPETCKTTDVPENFSVPPASVTSQYGPYTPTYGDPRNPYSPFSVTPYSAGASPFGTSPFGAQSNLAGMANQFGAQGSPMGVSTAGAQSSFGMAGDVDTASAGGTPSVSASAIFIQPQNVARGGTVLVSWTSVNMKPASCKVTKNDEEFAAGNEATKRDTMITAGSVTYSLVCTTPSGGNAKSAATVTIQ